MSYRIGFLAFSFINYQGRLSLFSRFTVVVNVNVCLVSSVSIIQVFCVRLNPVLFYCFSEVIVVMYFGCLRGAFLGDAVTPSAQRHIKLSPPTIHQMFLMHTYTHTLP